MTKSKTNLDVKYHFIAIVDGLPKTETERKMFDMSVHLANFLGQEGVQRSACSG